MDEVLAEKLDAIQGEVTFSGAQNSQAKIDETMDVCLFKMIIIGDTGVGKSCILTRLT